MMLLGGYFDESADERSERVYTVAGYMAPGWQSCIFELRWKDLLTKWKFNRFKASELEYGFGDFIQYRDDPSKQQDPLSSGEKSLIKQIKTEFVDLICNEPDLWGYSATINLRDYALLEIQEPDLARLIPRPYHLCGQLVMLQAGLDVETSNKKSPPWAQSLIRPIFDSHEDYEHHMIKSFQSYAEKNPNSSRFMLQPIYENEEAYPCLQAADCLAFESRKFADAATGPTPPNNPRIAFVRLMEHVRTAFYLDYKALKLIAEIQPKSNTIPIQPIVDNRQRGSQKRGE